jgi:hypothetical protein
MGKNGGTLELRVFFPKLDFAIMLTQSFMTSRRLSGGVSNLSKRINGFLRFRLFCLFVRVEELSRPARNGLFKWGNVEGPRSASHLFSGTSFDFRRAFKVCAPISQQLPDDFSDLQRALQLVEMPNCPNCNKPVYFGKYTLKGSTINA